MGHLVNVAFIVGAVSTHRCFLNLIDDAAMFPPGNAAMPQALLDHRRHLDSDRAAVVGPLLVRAADVSELGMLAADPMEVIIVGTGGAEGLPTALDQLAVRPALRLRGVELPIAAADNLALATKSRISSLISLLPPDVAVSIELPKTHAAGWDVAAAEILDAGFRTKLRIGGLTADAHPSEEDLGATLATLVAAGHRLKLTAGLHRAIRNTAPDTGFEQHGFVNVLVAVHGILDGAGAAEATHVLRDRDGAALAAAISGWSDAETDVVRRHFTAFGSCSIIEPYADLVDLGLVA